MVEALERKLCLDALLCDVDEVQDLLPIECRSLIGQLHQCKRALSLSLMSLPLLLVSSDIGVLAHCSVSSDICPCSVTSSAKSALTSVLAQLLLQLSQFWHLSLLNSFFGFCKMQGQIAMLVYCLLSPNDRVSARHVLKFYLPRNNDVQIEENDLPVRHLTTWSYGQPPQEDLHLLDFQPKSPKWFPISKVKTFKTK